MTNLWLASRSAMSLIATTILWGYLQVSDATPAAELCQLLGELCTGEEVRGAVDDGFRWRCAAGPGGEGLVLQVVAAADHEHDRLLVRAGRL